MKKIGLLSVLLIVGLIAGGAVAQTKAAHRLGNGALAQFFAGRRDKLKQLKDDLNLTDEQKTAVRETLAAHKSELAAVMKPVVEAKRTLRDAVLADTTNEQQIKDASAKLGTAIGDAAVVAAKVKTELKANAKLTPEHAQKIAGFRAENDASVNAVLQHVDATK